MTRTPQSFPEAGRRPVDEEAPHLACPGKTQREEGGEGECPSGRSHEPTQYRSTL
jgi:hypothetical protein